MNIEIIDFSVPTCNRKNLFVTNIPPVDESVVYSQLYETFSKCGLIYEVQIFPGVGHAQGGKHCSGTTPGFYAFVKFYSCRSAANARLALNEKLCIGDNKIKVVYAKRRKGDNQVTTLPLTKCSELANFYLGFNGWSCKLQLLEEDKNCEQQTGGDLEKVKFFCKVSLDLTNQNLSCDGFGVWEETLAKNDPRARSGSLAKVRKVAYMRAMENAFSKLLIISLPSGKVSVEVNTTLEEKMLKENQVDDDQLLKVNELTEEPQEEELEASEDMDDVNLQILQELEDQQ